MKILILYTLAPDVVADGRNRCEFDLHGGMKSIADVLPEAHVVGIQGRPEEVISLLSEQRPDLVFNVCEAPIGRPELEAHVAALLEWLGIPFTGSGSEALALCRRKDRTKAVLAAAGIPVPRTGVFPCIVKPAAEDGSAGIHADSICRDSNEVGRLVAKIGAPVVVEEFLSGREFAVSLWGHPEPDYFAIGESRFRGGTQLNTYAGKWDPNSAEFGNSPMVYDHDLEPQLRQAILTMARAAWHAVGLRGYGRVDIRLNSAGVPCVLEVNPNPDLAPGGGIQRAASEAGWTWAHFIRKQMEWTLSFANY